MKRLLLLISIMPLLTLVLPAQPASGVKQAVAEKRGPEAPAAVTPVELAAAVQAAHGGEKLKKLRSLVLKGSADLSFNGQAVPGAFSTVISGEKYYFEIVTAIQQLKQTFDGQQTYSSIPGFSLPPVTSLGFPLLCKIGDAVYPISVLPEGSKKRKGFRVTTPEGFYTDFFVHEKTGQIKGYESQWLDGGNRAITTSVEIDEFQTVDGLIVPKKYSQRFVLGPITAYANFNAKSVLVNTKIEDAAFVIPK